MPAAPLAAPTFACSAAPLCHPCGASTCHWQPTYLCYSLSLLLCSIWDDGTANPEPCLDQFTLVSKYGALGWLLGGMSIFAVAGTWATMSAPEKRVPWVSHGAEGGGHGWRNVQKGAMELAVWVRQVCAVRCWQAAAGRLWKAAAGRDSEAACRPTRSHGLQVAAYLMGRQQGWPRQQQWK